MKYIRGTCVDTRTVSERYYRGERELLKKGMFQEKKGYKTVA